MDDFKRLGLPLLIIALSALLTRIVNTYITGSFVYSLVIIISAFALFFFGYYLNRSYKKRSQKVITKVISILVVVLLLLMQLGMFTAPILADLIALLGGSSFYVHMIYIYCGYLFAD